VFLSETHVHLQSTLVALATLVRHCALYLFIFHCIFFTWLCIQSTLAAFVLAWAPSVHACRPRDTGKAVVLS
jgi:hypothetical protein